MIKPRKCIEETVRVRENEPSRLFKVRLDRNERNHPFTEAFIERLRKSLSGEILQVYPEPEPLYQAFSAFAGVDRNELLFNSGSDQSIKSVFETYVDPGDRILLHRPGYAMYPVYAGLFGATAEYQDFDADLHFDYNAYIERITGRYKIAVLENPNGFVGAAPAENVLRRFIDRCEDQGVIALIDEAYYHFHPVTAAEMIRQRENLIVVRTFSKAFGVAGVRAGYILSNRTNIEYLYRVKPMHELNSLAIFVILELLKDPQEFFSYVQATGDSRNHLRSGFAKLGIETGESAANFVAARLGKVTSGINLSEVMREQGILIRRPFREAHLLEWTRIATGPIPDMDRVLSIVRGLLL